MISELLINAFLVTIMVSIAIALIKTRTVIFTVILTSAYSLVAALMFITLDAVDVHLQKHQLAQEFPQYYFWQPWLIYQKRRRKH